MRDLCQACVDNTLTSTHTVHLSGSGFGVSQAVVRLCVGRVAHSHRRLFGMYLHHINHTHACVCWWVKDDKESVCMPLDGMITTSLWEGISMT